MTTTLDSIMEDASQALVAMDYRHTERLCVEALAAAKQDGQWAYYARILLPLQEARRQMRMNAADGDVHLGTSDLGSNATTWLDDRKAACLVITAPHTARDAAVMLTSATRDQRDVEVLMVDGPLDGDRWCVRSAVLDIAGNATASAVGAEVKAPPADWRHRWLGARQVSTSSGVTPADWFLDACEALGDAALAQVTAKPGTVEYIQALEECLHIAPTHEIVHQTLAQGARAMLR